MSVTPPLSRSRAPHPFRPLPPRRGPLPLTPHGAAPAADREPPGTVAGALAELSCRIGAATDPDVLLHDVTAGLRTLLAAADVRVYTGLTGTGRARLTTFAPAGAALAGAGDIAGGTLLDLLARRVGDFAVSAGACAALGLTPGSHAVVAALALDGEELGLLLVSFDSEPPPDAAELLHAVASQLRVALEKIELAGRVSAERAVDDLFAAIAAGDPHESRQRAAELHVALDEPFAIVHGTAASREPLPPLPGALAEEVASRLRRIAPALVCTIRDGRLVALVSLPRGGDEHALAGLDDALAELGAEHAIALGRSDAHRDAGDAARAQREARDAAGVARALRGAGGALAYRDLGVYRYLVRASAEEPMHDPYLDAIREVAAYDARRGSQLVLTLERYLATRGSIAETARLLTVHPNTLRQRLERIETLTGMDLTRADLLTLELAVKLAHLRADASDEQRRAA